MFGILLAIISGLSMTLQGVFNTQLGEKIGIWETNVIVSTSACLITVIISFFLRDGDYSMIKDSNKLYLLGGVLSIVITFTVMKSISLMGPSYGIGIILIAQIFSAAVIEALGLFGSNKVKFSLNEFIGIAIMILGIVIFKWKH